jgi:hypothetical protein
VRYQLRIYRLVPATADEFVELWRRDIVPLRIETGFSVVGAWRRPEENEFVWLVRWDGQGSFQEGDDLYYRSPGRAALEWDPADYLESSELRVLGAVEGFDA